MLAAAESESEVCSRMIQTAVIKDWHPSTNPNRRTSHWSVARKRHLVDRDTTCGALDLQRLTKITTRARLTIELVYPRNRLPDTDNAYARCKGVIDALKPHEHIQGRPAFSIKCSGYIVDDSPEWLDPHVVPIYEKGVKATRITLEPA